MRKTLETATFTGKDFSDVITTVLPSLLPKKMVATLGSKISKELLIKLKNQPKAKTVRISDFHKALNAYREQLVATGYTGKGRPTSEQTATATYRLSSQELRALELGKTKKWRKEIPAEFSIGNTFKPY